MRGDGRIHGVSPALQNSGACLRRKRRFRSDDPGLRDDHRAALAAILSEHVFVRHPRHQESRGHEQRTATEKSMHEGTKLQTICDRRRLTLIQGAIGVTLPL